MKKEYMRKTVHLGVGAVFSSIIFFGIVDWKFFLILLLTGISLTYIVSKTDRKILLLSKFIETFGRKDEYPAFGALTFIFGTFLTTLFFSREVATAAIIILAIGDSASAIISSEIGKTKIFLSKYKKLEGFIAGIILSFIAAAPIIGYLPALLGSVGSMIVETWDLTNIIDDNISIPLIAGIIMSLI